MRKIVSFVSALVIIAMQKYGKSFKLATNFLKSSTIICEKCFVTHNEAILLSNRLLNKRIVALFTVYRSGIAVSRIHDGVAGEGENLVAYAVNQLMVIAAYEVGAADARLEYDIAGYGPFGLWEIEDYAAG